MLNAFAHTFWPQLTKNEIDTYSVLSKIFFLLTASTWLMRSLKNIIFLKVAFPTVHGYSIDYGLSMQPMAKFLTPCIAIPLLLIYGILVDRLAKETIFCILISFYTVIFLSISCCLYLVQTDSPYLTKTFLSSMGWITFFSVETFYSFVTVLFWSITSSICTSSSAHLGYSLIFVLAQLACIIVSFPLVWIDSFGGIWTLFLFATFLSFFCIFIFNHFIQTRDKPPNTLPTSSKNDIHPSRNPLMYYASNLNTLWRDLYSICTHPYLICMFIMCASYEIMYQIIEFQYLTFAGHHQFFGSTSGLAQLQGFYGITVHVLTLIIMLIGTSRIIKSNNMYAYLLCVPLILMFVLMIQFFLSCFCQANNVNLLWINMGIMIFINVLGYTIYHPVKEILYIKTNYDIQFKSKSWIDIVGSRVAKQSGAQLNFFLKNDITQLIFFGTLCGIGLAVLWACAAYYLKTTSNNEPTH